MFSPSSRARLTDRDLGRFPDDTLFHRVARAVCHVGCLPRKELYEAWEMARRVRRVFRGGRVIDLGAGHGLLAQVMLLLDDSSPTALVVDTSLPPSSARLAVLPCCHDLETCDTGGLAGWLDGPLAIDVMRAVRLRQQGYRVWTLAI